MTNKMNRNTLRFYEYVKSYTAIYNGAAMMRKYGRFGPLIGAIDAGTSNVKFLIFAANTSEVLTYHQTIVKRFSPQEGWVEQDPTEILNAVNECIEVACDSLKKFDINAEDIVGIGISNQRETTIAWNATTGEPLYSAISWLDSRTAKVVDELIKTQGLRAVNTVTDISGLPLSTYFSSVKIKWLIQNVAAVKDALAVGQCMVGTVDTWLIWNLTGGQYGGIHVTDVTNASRTQLMSLRKLTWDDQLLRFFGIPPNILPKIKSSSEIYGYIATGCLAGLPVAGCLGDQQAALVGQNCMKFGQVKCTYGSGCFLLYNTGGASSDCIPKFTFICQNKGIFGLYNVFLKDAKRRRHWESALRIRFFKATQSARLCSAHFKEEDYFGDCIIRSKNGLLTTVAYKLGPNEKPVYALEGAIAVAGDALEWLRDNLGLINDVKDTEELAASVSDCNDFYFIPAFNGLYSPQWKKDARGTIVGMTSFTKPEHIVRAVFESVCQQVYTIARALTSDCSSMRRLLADGGMAQNTTLMQMQADILGVPVIRPLMTESTALGAAVVAGRALKVWPDYTPMPPADTFLSSITDEQREIRKLRWEEALRRCDDWVVDEKDLEQDEDTKNSSIAVLPSGLFLLGTALLFVVADKLK